MVKRNSMERLLIFLFLITLSTGYAQLKKFQFNEVLEKQPQKVTTFCVPNDSATTAFLQKEKVTYIENVAKIISNKIWSIRSSIDWVKFTQGL